MKHYRDPDTGRFISREEWERIQQLEGEEDYSDMDEYDDPDWPELGEEEYLG